VIFGSIISVSPRHYGVCLPYPHLHEGLSTGEMFGHVIAVVI
jgi:hypothetical protein